MKRKLRIAPIANIAHLGDVHSFLAQTRQERMMCLFGRPGLGKTQACRYLAEQTGAIYFEVPPNPSPFGFVAALAVALGMGRGRGFSDTLTAVSVELKARKQSLLLDEAGRLFHRYRDQLAEVARYFHDVAGIPVVLAGMPDLREALGRYPQLADRIHFLEFRCWSEADCQMVSDLCFSVKVKPDLIREIYRQTKGNGRLVCRALEHVENHALHSELAEIGINQWCDRPFLPEVAS